MSEIRVTTLKDTSGGNSSSTADIYSGRAKAWVNFNGVGTVAIRANFNVNSITDNGTGDYTVNFSTAMVDANANIVTTTFRAAVGDYSRQTQSYVNATSTAKIITWDSASSKEDHLYINASVFR